MSAAFDVFADYGYRQTTMELLAGAAGVSRPLLYKMVGNKECLFRTATEWRLAYTLTEIERATATTEDGTEQVFIVLNAMVDLYVPPGRNNSSRFAKIDETYAVAGDIWQAFMDDVLQHLRAAISQYRASGHRARRQLPSDTDVAESLFYAAKGLALDVGPRDKMKAHLQLLVRLVLP